MSNVITINGIPMMTYGLTGMLIAVLTYSTFAPGQTPNNNNDEILSTSFAIPTIVSPIPALLAPPTSDMLSTVIGTDESKSVTDRLTDTVQSVTTSVNDAAQSVTTSVNDAAQSVTTSVNDAAQSVTASVNGVVTDVQEKEKKEETEKKEEKETEKKEEKENEEEELGLRGGKKKKRRRTRKYKR
jgi:gas vesicle protein